MFRSTDKNTIAEKSIINRYLNSKCRTIYDAYKKPSESKRALYDYYLSECCRLGGKGFKILSYNIYKVTFAYILDDFLIVISPTRRLSIRYENV